MSRVAPAIPVTAKMYRHFAIVTVGITACLAMFADGENREAVHDSIVRQQQQQQMAAAEKNLTKSGKGGNSRREILDNRKVKGSWGRDPVKTEPFSDSAVAPDATYDERFAETESYDYGVAASEADEIVIPTSPPPGMTIEEFEKLKKELLRKKRRLQKKSA